MTMPRPNATAIRGRIIVRHIHRLTRDLLLDAGDRWDEDTFREDLARRYIRGDGIEIGALHRPLRLAHSTRVRYVDVMSRERLLATHSPAVFGRPEWVVETDVTDDGQSLRRFSDRSLDFVIANHMLEHVEDPVATLQHNLRVLRPGGVLFLTLPDPRYTFDALRERTTIEHLIRDHRDGPAMSREAHYREWAIVECTPEQRIAERMEEFAREDARHHFHVWELEGFLDFLSAIELPASLEIAQTHGAEFAVILRRRD